MRKFVIALLAFGIAMPATAQVHVRGYYRGDGTYVQPHVRSSPNSSRLDNYSTYPNVNPYTGREGTVNPYNTYQPPRYYSPPAYVPPAYTPPAYTPPPAPRGSRYSSGACVFGTYC